MDSSPCRNGIFRIALIVSIVLHLARLLEKNIAVIREIRVDIGEYWYPWNDSNPSSLSAHTVSDSFQAKSNTSKFSERSSKYAIEIQADSFKSVHAMTWWGNNTLCRTLKQHRGETILVNLTIPSCQNLYVHHHLGTGNWIWLLGGLRLAAKYHGRTDLRLACGDDDNPSIRQSLVLPWIMGEWKSKTTGNEDHGLLDQVCKGHVQCPIEKLVPEIREQLRTMAVSLAPIPPWINPRINRTMKKLNSDIELDEVAVHFRCGDLIRSRHRGYGLHKFQTWASHIRNSTSSIGIITQPISASGSAAQTRKRDGTGLEDDNDDDSQDDGCDLLLQTLVEYLQARFPSARIRIRNQPTETVAIAYSRLILAKQAIVAGWSTFGVYAALSSFGQPGLMRPSMRYAPNRWLNKSSVDKYLGISRWEDPHVLLAPQAYLMWLGPERNRSLMLRWLVEDDFRIPLRRYSNFTTKS